MAIRFDASGDYLRRTANLPSSTAFTIAGWYMNRGTGEGTWEAIFSLIASGGSNWAILYKRISGSTDVFIHGGSGQYDLGIALSNDTWYYVAFGSNGTGSSAMTGWVITQSGTVYTQSTYGVSFVPAELSISYNSAWSEWVNGRFANVMVWDTKLTQAQLIEQMWLARPIVARSSLRMWSPLFNASDLRDLSGNGYTWSSGGTLAQEDHPPVSWGAPVYNIPFAAAASGINGSLTKTLAAVTSSAAGDLDLAGSLTKTLAAVTLNSQGDLDIVAVVSQALGALSASGAADLEINASTAKMLAAVALSAAGQAALSGSLTKTLAAAVVSAAGEIDLVGEVDQTLAAVTSSGAGDLYLAGSVGVTLDAVTSAATGVLGTAINGEVDQTLAVLTSSAAGDLDLAGSLSRTLGALTASSVGNLEISGSLAETLAPAGIVSQGDLDISGSVGVTLGSLGISSEGTIVSGLIGSVGVILAGVTVAASGEVDLAGEVAGMLADTSLTAAGEVDLVGSVVETLGNVTTDFDGDLALVGALTKTLGSLALDAIGYMGALDEQPAETWVVLESVLVFDVPWYDPVFLADGVLYPYRVKYNNPVFAINHERPVFLVED